jgi:hypothetical protein
LLCIASHLATPRHDDTLKDRPVIPPGEAIHTGTLDCFASHFATPRHDDMQKDRPVIANPPGEAIHASTLDGFALLRFALRSSSS